MRFISGFCENSSHARSTFFQRFNVLKVCDFLVFYGNFKHYANPHLIQSCLHLQQTRQHNPSNVSSAEFMLTTLCRRRHP